MIRWVTVKRFSELTGIPEQTIRNRQHNGHYPPDMIKKDGGKPMYDYERYNKWMENQE